MDLASTKHADTRLQQRNIPPLIVDWLTRYGAKQHDHNGAEVLYFDKRSRKDLARHVGDEVVKRLSGLLDAYAVVSTDTGVVITVGHRYKRIKGH